MITKLTKEQEKGILEWQAHCLQIGRDTSPINKKLTEESWVKFYNILGKKNPYFWYCQSPLQAQIIVNIFPEIQKFFSIEKGANIRDNIRANIRANIETNIWTNIRANIRANIETNIGDNIRANIGANIWANIGANIRDNIRDNIGANIGDNIRDNIGAKIRANIWTNIGYNIGDNIGANIGANIRDNIRNNIGTNIWTNIRANIGANIRDNIRANIGKLNFNFIETYSWCQHDINWIAYYKYFKKYGLLPTDKNFEIFDIWYDLSCSCGWCYTFENIIFVCEKPKILHLNNRGQLHNDKEMALEYSDGYGLYMLNGVRVPQYVVDTPAEKIDPTIALTEQNTDIQREIIRKIGAERMLKACNAKELDVFTDKHTGGGNTYKLMQMTIGNNINRKYLVFEHASLSGVFYAKPIPPECKKALHARSWILSLLEREDLSKLDVSSEAELIANLPQFVS